jgi:Na+-driven multidrug efflux pump
VAITSGTVIALTAVAGRLGRDAQVGYAVAARLEYVIIPLSFTFGMALVAMVGTNWGARLHARARRVGWTGAALSAGTCGALGVFFAFFPQLWMGLFTGEEAVAREGASYLRIVAPLYAAYGLAQAFYFSLQGMGRIDAAVLANAARFAVSVGGGLLAIALGAGTPGLFAAIAFGFALHAALNGWLLARAAQERPGG